MRTHHGALLLVLAMVMAMLSAGICAGIAPVPAPTPKANSPDPHPYRCWKPLSYSGCDQKACDTNCFTKLKGVGFCTHGRDDPKAAAACWCYYPCDVAAPAPA